MQFHYEVNIGQVIQVLVTVLGFIITYTKLVQRITRWETKLEIMWEAFSRRWTGEVRHDENPFDGFTQSVEEVPVARAHHQVGHLDPSLP